MSGLVLDLRNNPGGLLDVAVKVVDKFIPADKIIVSIRGRYSSEYGVLNLQIAPNIQIFL